MAVVHVEHPLFSKEMEHQQEDTFPPCAAFVVSDTRLIRRDVRGKGREPHSWLDPVEHLGCGVVPTRALTLHHDRSVLVQGWWRLASFTHRIPKSDPSAVCRRITRHASSCTREGDASAVAGVRVVTGLSVRDGLSGRRGERRLGGLRAVELVVRVVATVGLPAILPAAASAWQFRVRLGVRRKREPYRSAAP